MKFFFLIFQFFLILSTVHATEWQKIEGRFATVEYPAGMEKTADSLLKIAELAIPRISNMVGVPLDVYKNQKTRIILTASPDVSNGFAIGNSVTIYATSSAYPFNWAGNVNWYHQVLTHELVHHVTFRAVERKLNVLGLVFQADVPRWFWEGTAQYYSEYWNAYRGDLYVKNAILDGYMTPSAINSLSDGRLLYAGGHAFVRYLAAEYGDSSLIKVMGHEPDGWLYNFDDAMKAVYKKPVSDLYTDFHRHMVLHYGDRFADFNTELPDDFIKSPGFAVGQIIPLSTKDSSYLAVVRQSKTDQFNKLVTYNTRGGKTTVEKTWANDVASLVSVDTDRQLAAYARPWMSFEGDQLRTEYQWYLIDMKNGSRFKLPGSKRAIYSSFGPDGLYLLETFDDHSVINVFDLDSKTTTTVFETKWVLGPFDVSTDGDLVFTMQRENGHHDLFLFSGGQLTALTNDPEPDTNPFWVDQETVIFTRFIEDHPGISSISLKDRQVKPHVYGLSEFWVTQKKQDGSRVMASTWTARRKTTFSELKTDSLLSIHHTVPTNHNNPAYSEWKTKEPEFGDVKRLPDTTLTISSRERILFPQMTMEHLLSFAFPDANAEDYGLIGSTFWMDPLQRQLLFFTGSIYANNPDNNFIAASHLISQWGLTLASTYYQGPSIFTNFNGTYYASIQQIGYSLLQKPMFVDHSTRFTFVPGLGLYGAFRKYEDRIPGAPKEVGFWGPLVQLQTGYQLPSTLNGLVDKRSILLTGEFFQSVSSDYDFSISKFSLNAGHHLYFDRLGLIAKTTYIQVNGANAPGHPVGVDRLYNLALPRDYGFVETIRGLEQDVLGTKLIWASVNLNWVLTEETGLKLLFIPMNQFMLSGFYDVASVSNSGNRADVYSYGSELSFGVEGIRFGTGYAWVHDANDRDEERAYFRLSLQVPGL